MKNPRDPSCRMCCRDEQGEERSIMRRIQGVCGRWTQDGPKGGMILMAVCFHCSHKIQCLLCVSICMSHPSLSKVLIKPPFPSEANLWEAFFFFSPLAQHGGISQQNACPLRYITIPLSFVHHCLSVSHTFSDPVCVKMKMLFWIINAHRVIVWLLQGDVKSLCLCVKVVDVVKVFTAESP